MNNNELQPVLLNAQEAYMQSTTNKYMLARKHLKSIIIKINNAIEKGKFSIDVEPNYLTEVDIEYLKFHEYQYETGKNYYDRIIWDLHDKKKIASEMI